MDDILFVIDDVYFFKVKGLIISGYANESNLTIKKGSRLNLERPDGTFINSEIVGFSTILNKEMDKLNVSIILPRTLQKEEVPIGTVVRLLS